MGFFYPDVRVERAKIDWPIFVDYEIDPRVESIDESTQKEAWAEEGDGERPSYAEFASGHSASVFVRGAASSGDKTSEILQLSTRRVRVREARGTKSDERLHIGDGPNSSALGCFKMNNPFFLPGPLCQWWKYMFFCTNADLSKWYVTLSK